MYFTMLIVDNISPWFKRIQTYSGDHNGIRRQYSQENYGLAGHISEQAQAAHPLYFPVEARSDNFSFKACYGKVWPRIQDLDDLFSIPQDKDYYGERGWEISTILHEQKNHQ